MDSIILLIAGTTGILIGGSLGFAGAAILADRRNKKTERAAWRRAEHFYRTAYTLTPKG